MDKKMHQITKKMKIAGKEISQGKDIEASKVLKKAEKKNEKLVKIDREIRDPKIKKCDMMMKKKK
jgi:hypothetical protein